MSSSNIHSTVNFSSPATVVSSPLPSVFELLAQERLADLLRPCLRHILKYLHEFRPVSSLLRTLYKYKDEFILLIEGIIQWLYMQYYSALIGERFYGLKRTVNNRLRSLIISVFLPYVKRKLDSVADEMNTNNNNPGAAFYVMLKLLPKIEMFIEGVCWLYRLGYAFGRTEYYSPALQLAGVKLIYAREPAPSAAPTTTMGRLFSVVNQVMSSGLFLIQFADWWNSATGSKRKVTSSPASFPVPTGIPTRANIHRRQCPICQQPCNVPTAAIGSGYVYCYQCITDYVNRHHRCPTTQQPLTVEQLVKIY